MAMALIFLIVMHSQYFALTYFPCSPSCDYSQDILSLTIFTLLVKIALLSVATLGSPYLVFSFDIHYCLLF